VVKERLLHPSGSCEVCDDIRARSEAGELIVLYDISISGGYRGDVTVTIPVGEAYNGQSLTVIHCSDKTLEEKTFTVMDGKVSGVFSGLSPFGVLKPTSNDHNPDAGGDFDAPQTKDPGYRPRRWLWALIPAVLLIGDIGIVIWRWRKSRA
jgi:hypothetical protein